jgi:hypothetical protein
VGNPRDNCVADEPSSTPAGRSRQPRTNTRKCGSQPAHQSLLNRRLDGSVASPAQSLYPAAPGSCPGIAHPRPGSLTTNIRVHWSSLKLRLLSGAFSLPKPHHSNDFSRLDKDPPRTALLPAPAMAGCCEAGRLEPLKKGAAIPMSPGRLAGLSRGSRPPRP